MLPKCVLRHQKAQPRTCALHWNLTILYSKHWQMSKGRRSQGLASGWMACHPPAIFQSFKRRCFLNVHVFANGPVDLDDAWVARGGEVWELRCFDLCFRCLPLTRRLGLLGFQGLCCLDGVQSRLHIGGALSERIAHGAIATQDKTDFLGLILNAIACVLPFQKEALQIHQQQIAWHSDCGKLLWKEPALPETSGFVSAHKRIQYKNANTLESRRSVRCLPRNI